MLVPQYSCSVTLPETSTKFSHDGRKTDPISIRPVLESFIHYRYFQVRCVLPTTSSYYSRHFVVIVTFYHYERDLRKMDTLLFRDKANEETIIVNLCQGLTTPLIKHSKDVKSNFLRASSVESGRSYNKNNVIHVGYTLLLY